MSLLRSARVCVIDDEPEEYQELLRALNSMGVGAIHFHGDRAEELPAAGHQFTSLRLVFLDMHLGTYSGMDARAVTAQTARVFAQVVSPESAPVVVVVWTKHPDYVESFRASLFEAQPEFRGRLFFIRMDKPTSGARTTADELRQKIETELSSLAPLPLLWNWDGLVQKAASCVTTELCRLASKQASLSGSENEEDERAKMLGALNSILHFLLKAEAGNALDTASAPSAIFGILGPLHADRLENLPSRSDGSLVAPVLEAGRNSGGPKADVLVALNTMLLVGGHNDEGVRFRPGTIYQICDAAAFESAMGISVGVIAAALCQKELLKPERTADLATWVSNCRPILLEVSPGCDFAQGKRPVSRLIAGVLVTQEASKQLKQRKEEGFSVLRILDRVRIAALDSKTEWVPAFTSAFVLSWPEKKPAPFLNPVSRLKEPVIADFRNWLSHQSSRPGYLVVSEK